MNRRIGLLFGLTLLCGAQQALADTAWSTQDYDLYPGDFNGDGPQSNGMAEAFVKTFKRDYLYVHDRPDAQTVLSQLP